MQNADKNCDSKMLKMKLYVLNEMNYIYILHITDNYKDNRRDNKYLIINHRNKVSSMLNQSDQLSLGEGNKYKSKVKTLY